MSSSPGVPVRLGKELVILGLPRNLKYNFHFILFSLFFVIVSSLLSALSLMIMTEDDWFIRILFSANFGPAITLLVRLVERETERENSNYRKLSRNTLTGAFSMKGDLQRHQDGNGE